jgi:hypothetical protein
MVAFADCMTKHGVPVSVSHTGVQVKIGAAGSGSRVTPGSPRFQAAQQACAKLLPGGGPGGGTPAEQAQARQHALAISACMRQHGYPSFPDPDSHGVLNLSNTNIDPGDSRFQSAMKTCSQNGGPGRVAIFRGPPGATPP